MRVTWRLGWVGGKKGRGVAKSGGEGPLAGYIGPEFGSPRALPGLRCRNTESGITRIINPQNLKGEKRELKTVLPKTGRDAAG